MPTSFSEFKQRKDDSAFRLDVHALCESIVLSGMDFDNYWIRFGLPAVIKSEAFITEKELLKEFWNPFKNMFGRSAQAPAGPRPPATSGYDYGPEGNSLNQLPPRMRDALMGAPDKPYTDDQAARHASDPEIVQKQDEVNKSVEAVKKRFNVAMRDFLKTVTDDAKNNNNPYEWQIAKMFHDRLMKTAQPAIDNFAVNVKRGSGDWKGGFDKERNAMLGAQRQSAQDALKAKFGNRGTMAGAGHFKPAGSAGTQGPSFAGGMPQYTQQQGPAVDPNNPEIQAMRQKMAQGYDPFRDFGAAPADPTATTTTFAGPSPRARKKPAAPAPTPTV